jgi:hypothetical protein
MILAAVLAIVVGATALLSLTWGKILMRRRPSLAIWCCGLAAPLLLLAAAGVHWVVTAGSPPPEAATDQWPLGLILLILAIVSLPFTLLTSIVAAWRTYSSPSGR